MNQPHISEERMLEVLDRLAVPWSPAEADHLRSCPACAAVLDEYRALYPQLAGLPLPELPADFSLQVLANLPRAGQARQGAGPAILWLGLGMMTVGLLIGLQSFYGLFNNLGGSLGKLFGSFASQLEYGKQAFGFISADTLRLLLTVPLCFGAVGLLDRLIRRRRQSASRT